ncbi:hypothetical protein [Candidatus Palauibacter sp.]|uniref:hypothetical protein n=1 Tax=Candidatus Palauibacter sp. TaxID=3101350 RepID=UPI003AF23636
MGVFEFIIIIVGLVTFGEVASKWFEGRRSRSEIAPGRDGPSDEEIARLREHVALLASQVDRLSEEQRFMTRLLETGARGRRASSGEPRPEGRPDSRLREPI